MPRVTCRCGEKLKIRADAPERIECSKCGARIRLRRPAPKDEAGDGFLRFLCPCGRRLKVPMVDRPVTGKCPDCGRIVPVPTSAHAFSTTTPPKKAGLSDFEARTEELDDCDRAQLEKWAARYPVNPGCPPAPFSTTTGFIPITAGSHPNAEAGLLNPNIPSSVVKFEAGLRVCPRCKKPVHIGAANCRECGTPVPRQ